MITQQSVPSLALMPGMSVWGMFKSNAPILGVLPPLAIAK
jgi:molybdate transport system regulatory protein